MKPVRGILILSFASLVACAGGPVTPSESSDVTIPSSDISSSQVSSSASESSSSSASSSESSEEPAPEPEPEPSPSESSSEESSSSESSSSSSESSSEQSSEESSEQSSEESSEQSSESSSESSSASSSSSQEPYTGYYAGISTTATGATLKTALYNLIKGHTNKGYDFAYEAYPTSDVGSDGKIIDIYSNQKFDPYTDHQGAPGKSDYKKEGDCFNREHTVPQSVFSEGQPMKSDLHHLLPTDGYANNRRSNYPHAEVATATWSSSNGCKLGDSVTTGYTGKAFEVPDQYKGDIARIYFYMVTRYENVLKNWKNFAAFSKNSYPSLSSWAITLYLKWSDMDPVSEKEITRNEVIYGFQKNRNPFVDHPEFAHKIWDGAN